MEITVAEGCDCTVLAVTGRLDTTTAPQLEKEALSVLGERRNLDLDVAGVSYVSSAGLRVLIVAQKCALKNAARLRLRGVSAGVLEILQMTGFDTLLTMVP